MVTVVLLASGAMAAQRPNVVLILSDDQGWSDYGFMGHKDILTPHIDKLASQSAVFLKGYVPVPLCRASLSCLITGLYAHQHKITSNDPPKTTKNGKFDKVKFEADREVMRSFLGQVPTFPGMLAKAGYKCLQTGKFWEGHYSNGGFTHGMTTEGRHGGPGLDIGRRTMQPIYDFIDQCGDNPFFIWYAPMMPHAPHNPPDRILRKYIIKDINIKLAKYWAMCEWFDETCGDLLGYLDKKGLSDNTIIVYLADNGWIQDTRPGKGSKSTRKGKMSPYDGGLRTPVMIRWPGYTRPGQYPDLVSSIDLAPTILTACGLKPTEQMPGLNLLDAAAGKGRLKRKAIFGEVFTHNAVDIHKPATSLTHRWVRQGDWKLIYPEELSNNYPHSIPHSPELYNLAEDPIENNNLAEAQPKKVRQLNKLIDKWWPIKSNK
jgi:uncharacterized sulfatase